jgi:hypothetical protein
LEFTPYTDQDDRPPITDDDGTEAVAELAPTDAESIAAIADEFVAGLKPAWHREWKVIRLESINATLQVANLWTLLTPPLIDRTRYCTELQTKDGNPSKTGAALALLKQYVLLTAGRIMRTLPDEENAQGQLIDTLCRFFSAPRVLRLENTTSPTTYWDWAQSVAAGTGWQAFPGGMLFAKIVDGSDRPDVAVKGEALAREMKHASTKAMSRAFQGAGLIEKRVIRTGNVTRKVWVVSSEAIYRNMNGGNIADER